MCSTIGRFLVDPDPKPARRVIVRALIQLLCCGKAKPIDFTFSEN
jgi:hypothetical protein